MGGSAGTMASQIRVGTSGFHYKHWHGPFYPPGTPPRKMLDFYISRFDTVELNNSFYRLPSEAAFDVWRTSTPANFLFAVKASRYLTHRKKLKDPESAMNMLLPRVVHLGTKLGPILFQLPPRWQVNRDRLQELLQVLPATFRYVFEFRGQTWITPEINELLCRFRAAFCIYELAGYRLPSIVTTDFAYVRLHGPGMGKYQGSYDDRTLRQWCCQILEWTKTLNAVYVYFDNDQAGYAAQNAMTLKRMVLGNES